MSVENIDAETLNEWAREKSVDLIDVRNDDEVRRGVIAGARHIPLQALPARVDEVARDRPVVFYCQSGARSMQAGAFLSSRGWKQVYNLTGGLLAWSRSGFPVVQFEASRNDAH